LSALLAQAHPISKPSTDPENSNNFSVPSKLDYIRKTPHLY
jgi:hypothetical protein